MREIDPQKIEDGTLTYAEATYLQNRGRLPKGYDMPDDDGEDEVVEAPRSRITPLEEQDEIEFDDDDSLDEVDPSPSKYPPTEEQSQLKIRDAGGIEEDEDEDYLEGWNNDQRRAELAKRELSVEGRKEDMIARLLRSDSDELLDEDYSTILD